MSGFSLYTSENEIYNVTYTHKLSEYDKPILKLNKNTWLLSITDDKENDIDVKPEIMKIIKRIVPLKNHVRSVMYLDLDDDFLHSGYGSFDLRQKKMVWNRYEDESDLPIKSDEVCEYHDMEENRKTGKLKHGDVIMMGDYRAASWLIYDQDRLVRNPDNSEAGYLTIPIEVTDMMEDPVYFYTKSPNEYLTDIELNIAGIKLIYDPTYILRFM